MRHRYFDLAKRILDFFPVLTAGGLRRIECLEPIFWNEGDLRGYLADNSEPACVKKEG